MTSDFHTLIAPALDSLIPHPRQGDALDLGCGSGRSSRFLRDIGFRVTGLDNNPRLIEIARSTEVGHITPIEYQLSDFLKSSQSTKFDVVLISLVMLTLPDLELVRRLFMAAKMALREGGLLLLADLHPHNKGRSNQVEVSYFDEGNNYFNDGATFKSKARLSGGGTKVFWPNYHYKLETIVNAILASGLAITAMAEPRGAADYPTHFVLRAAVP